MAANAKKVGSWNENLMDPATVVGPQQGEMKMKNRNWRKQIVSYSGQAIMNVIRFFFYEPRLIQYVTPEKAPRVVARASETHLEVMKYFSQGF